MAMFFKVPDFDVILAKSRAEGDSNCVSGNNSLKGAIRLA